MTARIVPAPVWRALVVVARRVEVESLYRGHWPAVLAMAQKPLQGVFRAVVHTPPRRDHLAP